MGDLLASISHKSIYFFVSTTYKYVKSYNNIRKYVANYRLLGFKHDYKRLDSNHKAFIQRCLKIAKVVTFDQLGIYQVRLSLLVFCKFLFSVITF